MPPLNRDELIDALLKDIDQKQDPELYNDTRQAFEGASENQLFTWYNQQNDPGQAKENAWSAGVETANNDLSQNSFPEIDEQARDEYAKELANDLEALEKALAVDQALAQNHEHEQEQEH